MAVNDVKKIYQEIINDVCTSVSDALTHEGLDNHTLKELRTLWEKRLENSRALEPLPTSIVDQATNREFRHPTTTGDSNHSSSSATTASSSSSAAATGHSKQATGLKSINNRLHPASNVAVTSYTPTFSTSAHANPGILSATNPGVTQFVRPTFTTRPTNPTHSINAPMKTSHQVDGTNDEMCPEKSTMKKTTKRRKKSSTMIEIVLQVDGTGPPAGDDDDEDDDSELEGQDVEDDLDDDDDDDGNEEGKEDPNPLCSDDDVSDDEPSELFDADNVVVCQYDKITRTKNKWRFILKSGVMNLEGRDYVFSKATGEADW